MIKKEFLRELKDLGLSNKQTRKDIVALFSGASVGTQTEEEKKKNQQRIFHILMKEESVIRKFLMENIGLSDDTLTLLNQYLSGKEFYDLKLLFESLKDFFSSHYKTVDFVVYRLNKTKNSLEFFAGKDSLATNISLGEVNNNDYKNEVLAIHSSTSKFFSIYGESHHDEETIGAVASIKIKTSTDTFVFGFHRKEMEDIDEHDLKSDVLKIKKLFTKYGLITILDNIIKYINAKYKDELTGIFNRNFINVLPKHMKYSVLFIDLDRFKLINDTYGHQNGDKVLQGVASVLKDSVRPRDKVCRISGDEFAILVPTNSSAELNAIEKRILNGLGEKIFYFKNNETGNEDKIIISATIGKALANSKASLEQIITEADLEMLGGKTSGGNNYRLFSAINILPIEEQKKILGMGICDVRCGLRPQGEEIKKE